MMKLAICDDDSKLIAQVDKLIEKYNQANTEETGFAGIFYLFHGSAG